MVLSDVEVLLFFPEQITPVIPVWLIWCCLSKPAAQVVIAISCAGDRVRGDRAPAPLCLPCLPSRQSGQKLDGTLLLHRLSIQGCWSQGMDSPKLKVPGYKSLVMGPQLCPPALEELVKSSICGRTPPISVLSARLNYGIKSAHMNYSEGFGVKFMLEK